MLAGACDVSAAQTRLALPQPAPAAMAAEEVKEALRRRHPAMWPGTDDTPGAWTCLEEYMNVDLLAFGVWAGARRVGYEVKVSRSDYRRELLRPGKKWRGMTFCHQFYFATPIHLLTDDELDWQEPGGFDPLDKDQLADAPTLWVPVDVGLLVVEPWGASSRCRVLKEAPHTEPTRVLDQREIGELVRWASARPDPRHRRPAGDEAAA